MEVEKTLKKPTLLSYFNINDGIHVVWAHAVNNKTYLDDVLSNPKIMMLEADVSMDPVKNLPIMAHPPDTSSDITLEQWLSTCDRTNKGLKLDFKQLSAGMKSYDTVKHFISDQKSSRWDSSQPNSNIRRPIILNADILPGPNSNPMVNAMDPNLFITMCKSITGVILSPGWITAFEPDKPGYSWENVQKMFTLVKDLDQEITFPVRASLVGRSSEQLLWLLKQKSERFSLTVWTSKYDKYDVKELLFLRMHREQVYFDLPESEISELISLSN